MIVNSQILSKEQVLIVGCGDVGARLAKLLPDGYIVTGLRRKPPVNTEYLRYQTCDVTDASQLDSILKSTNFSVIVITMTPSERTDAGYEASYVQTCKNLIASLEKHCCSPRLVVFVSSTGVYGQQDGSWVDENSSTQPDSFNGRRLLEAENIIFASSFACVIVRFSGIYGANRTRLIDQVLEGRAQLSLQMTNRIHVDDCAAALLHLIELHRQGTQLDRIYLATDNAPVTLAEVLTWLAQQMGASPPVTWVDTATDNSNKSCSNQRLIASGFRLHYPSYREGYAATLADKLADKLIKKST